MNYKSQNRGEALQLTSAVGSETKTSVGIGHRVLIRRDLTFNSGSRPPCWWQLILKSSLTFLDVGQHLWIYDFEVPLHLQVFPVNTSVGDQ